MKTVGPGSCGGDSTGIGPEQTLGKRVKQVVAQTKTPVIKEDSQETTFLERLFGDFFHAEKVTGVWGEEPQGYQGR